MWLWPFNDMIELVSGMPAPRECEGRSWFQGSSSPVTLFSDPLRCVRFEVFTAVTMKNGVFWDITPCGSCKNRRFGGT
jgi:hypothetical protein